MKKLFVSSTFKDMQLERDALGKRVIPELNMRLVDYGTKITQTDLRWGISTSEMSAEEGEQKVLNVCLEEINKARPYMIVMIGDRYGWEPSSSIIKMAASGRDISLESYDISVTQLEIEYIAFTGRWDESRIFFYFRDFDYGDMSQSERETYECESLEARKKLDELKARIEKRFPTQINHYTLRYKNGQILGIEEFERLVSEDLYNLFLHDAEEDEKIDINERVRAKLHYEAKESFPVYHRLLDISNQKLQSDVLTKTDMEKTHTYQAGPPRCGKSLSVSAYYTAIYAYQNRRDPMWKLAEPMFEINNSFFKGDGIYSGIPSIVDIENTLPLYLQLGNCKDIATSKDLWRTLLYFLNKQLGISIKIPDEKELLIASVAGSLRLLMQSKKSVFLFLDDLSPEALDDLFLIEHSFDDEEIPRLLEHLYFHISFNNQFTKVPVYVPFYNYSQICQYNEWLMHPSYYFHAYARRLGKEISPAVVDYINGYYGTDRSKYQDVETRHITRPLASLMANYFMNFVSDDYQKIKEMGNDMKAIESQNLRLLESLNGSYQDDKDGKTLKRVALLNIEKFDANHSQKTMRMLGIIYLLTGASFSMQEAKDIYSYFGEEWSDLDYVCYFDDFKEFFVYNKAEDSYQVLPAFHSMLRGHLIEKYLSGEGEIERAVERLISAVISAGFLDESRDELIYSLLLVQNSDFIVKMLPRLRGRDDYDTGLRLGRSANRLINTLTSEESYLLGETLSPILSRHLSCEAICGFFNGIGLGFQNHEYEKKVFALADALMPTYVLDNDEIGASIALGVHLLGVYCYLGYKNDVVLELICEAEPYVESACLDFRVRYLSIISSLMRKFDEGSPVFTRLTEIIIRFIPEKKPLSYESEREISISADLYTISFFVNEYSIKENYYDEEEILSWFINRDRFHKLGLYNIDTAIYALDASKIGMDALVERTAMLMESLAVHFPVSGYAQRLISYAMLSRMFNVPKVIAEDDRPKELEKYFYPYRKAVMNSGDGSCYHFINYALFLQNARYFHISTGITHSMDEMMWETNPIGNWVVTLDKENEESIDLLISICWVYWAYLRDPNFHDMISTSEFEDYKYSEYDAEEPSKKAVFYRFTKTLNAVLHNPKSLIMKPKLKKQFNAIMKDYGDYVDSLSSIHYKRIKKYIDEL